MDLKDIKSPLMQKAIEELIECMAMLGVTEQTDIDRVFDTTLRELL